MILLFSASPVLADPPRFDLAGPTLDVTVTHAGAALPISRVPNLSAGDQLSIKADLPAGQSAHYLLVAAFLRGATNPPPETWFVRSPTWDPKAQGGLKITVPPGAQQMLVFLAPETGGDFKTLVSAVRGRPGAFVRASQDLNQASLDRSRLDAFLAAVRKTGRDDPDHLKDISALLARGLGIKLDADCFQKVQELQAACLMQGQDSLVLDDGHSTSIVQALTTGSTADLVQQLSATPQAGLGYYSPYVGAVMDIARLMESFHTARYQYIPALATFQADRLSLVLNTPPSFHSPMSVLVVALPAVEPPRAPPLRPVDSKDAYCAARPDLLLPVEGAPLVFSTGYARDMVLRLKRRGGEPIDLPVRADAGKGGLIVDTAGFGPAGIEGPLDGALHGNWGFEPFEGPQFRLETARPQPWRLAEGDEQSLIVGRDAAVRLQAPGAACVEAVMLRQPSGETQTLAWKPTGPEELAVTVPLGPFQPGPVTLLVKPYGRQEPDAVTLRAYAQAGRLDSFAFHAGDLTGTLQGARLDEVAGLTLRGVTFTPAQLTTAGGADELTLATADAEAAGKLKAGETAAAKVALKDGRTVALKVSVQSTRPSIALIAKSIRADAPGARHAIELADKDELARGATLTFSVHAQAPARFSGHEQLEVATLDSAARATLTLADGLVLEDSQVALATLDTAKAFNPSAFGALRFRIVEDGAAGDWQPLATLVRLPVLRDLKCPAGPGKPCELTGADLFLIDQPSSGPTFDHPVTVPEGFTGDILSVPHPTRAGRLYVKLRDDPQVVNRLDLPAKDLAPAPGA